MRKRLRAAALVSAALFCVAACGAGSPGDREESGRAGNVLRVGETDGMPSAFLQFGKQRGYFKDHGIDIEIKPSAGGAAAIPGLVGGDLDIAGSNVVSGMLAGHQGLPVRVIAPGTFATDDTAKDFSGVLVPHGSGIASAKDLEGRTIAVNTLENIGDITIEAALEKRGVDTSGIEFVEIDFPQMLPALKNGRVDAAWVIEPFLSMGGAQGDRTVLRPYAEARRGLQVGSYLATDRFMKENRARAEAFRAGVADTARAISEDPDSFRKALPKITKMKPPIASKVTLPQFKSDVDAGSLRFIADRMLRRGYVDERIDVDAVTAR